MLEIQLLDVNRILFEKKIINALYIFLMFVDVMIMNIAALGFSPHLGVYPMLPSTPPYPIKGR